MRKDIFEHLIRGNEMFLKSNKEFGDFSIERRNSTYENGQKPYAIVVSCSDSRVIPEIIFFAGIGDLFIIRSLGNFVGENELEAISYAVEHLKINHILVLGHTDCGAVTAAINQGSEVCNSSIVNSIKKIIKDEKDYYKCENIYLDYLKDKINHRINQDGKLKVKKAINDINTGEVYF